MAKHLSASVLTWLRSFEASGRLKSFTKAADELFISQSAVSQQVKNLESWLGKSLLIRAPKNLNLTAEGMGVYLVLTEAFNQIDSVLHGMRLTPKDQPLLLNCTPSLAMNWIAPRLGEFQNVSNGISLRMHLDYLPISRSRLVQEGIDVAIRYDGGEYDSGFHTTKILEEWLVPVAAPAFLAANPIQGLQSLAGEQLLHARRSDDSPPYDEWQSWFDAAGIAGPRMDSGKTYNMSALAQTAAIAGQGVAIGRVSHVYDDIRSGRLVPLVDWCIRSRYAYYLICLQERHSNIALAERWILEQANDFNAARARYFRLRVS